MFCYTALRTDTIRAQKTQKTTGLLNMMMEALYIDSGTSKQGNFAGKKLATVEHAEQHSFC